MYTQYTYTCTCTFMCTVHVHVCLCLMCVPLYVSILFPSPSFPFSLSPSHRFSTCISLSSPLHPSLPPSLLPSHLPPSQNIGHSSTLVQEGISQFNKLLASLSPFLESPERAGASVLLEEIGDMPSTLQMPTTTPLLQKLVAVNGFIRMFIHLCKSHLGFNVYVSIT